MKKKKVEFVLDDIDRHGAGCKCGLCNSNGKSYGVAIMVGGELVERVYGPSECAAMHNAKMVASEK